VPPTWDPLDLEQLAAVLRQALPPDEAQRILRAYEIVVTVAQTDASLLPELLGAATCLVAVTEGLTPRDVAEKLFCRSASDDTWREVFLPLFTRP
jgi:hypothetical protein